MRTITIVVAVLLLVCTAAAAQSTLTWTVLADFQGTKNPSQPRSIRGLALTSDDSAIYAGFIQGTSSSAIRYVDTADGDLLGGCTTYVQPKGIATDDRGNFYATLSDPAGKKVQKFAIFNPSVDSLIGQDIPPSRQFSCAATSVNAQLAGISVSKQGNQYYLYIAHNKGVATIERWNVTDRDNPFLDTSWATGGILNLKNLFGANAYVAGIEVASDGTIYAAGGVQSNTSYGDSVFKIGSDLTTVSSASILGAMDVALYGGNVYVTQYLSSNSAIGVFSQSNLSLVDTLYTGIAHPYSLDADNGYSGIDIDALGRIYVADQIYDVRSSNTLCDRILVSSAQATAVPEPMSIVLGIMGVASIAGYRRFRK